MNTLLPLLLHLHFLWRLISTLGSFENSMASQLREASHFDRMSRPWSQVRGSCNLGRSPTLPSEQDKGEGCDRSMTVTGAVHPSWGTAKTHGSTPTVRDHHLVSNHKRSFRRAVKRARVEGYAWFRGRLFDAKELGTQVCPRPNNKPSPVAPPLTPARSDPRNRVHIFSWNCSGLSRVQLEEILEWAALQPLQLLVLQEIRWQGTREWSNQNWHFIAVGGIPRQATGVLIAVRRSFCQIHQISWRSIWEGRLLHLRIHLDRPLDVLNCYQKTFQATPQDLRARADLFQMLDDCIASLPTRNTLILVGDFNTSLAHDPPHVGYSQFVGCDGKLTTGPSHSDRSVFQAILKTHGLCALNTMQPGLPATFRGCKGQGSRIDFVCVRIKQMDREASQCAAIPSCPLLGLSTQGHLPLICSISLSWKPWTGAALSQVSFEHRNRGRLARTHNTSDWHDFSAHTQLLLQRSTWPLDGNFSHLHHELNHVLQDSFSVTAERVVKTGHSQGFAARKWSLFRRIHATRGFDLCSVFDRWKLIVQHHQTHRQQKEASAQAKQDRIHQVLEEARQAADRNDMSRLHQLVRRLSPKTKTSRIQIRSADGQILSPLEEFTHLKCFVQKTWHDEPLPTMLTPRGPGIPFSTDELESALARVAPLKANAPGTCASLSILCCPELIAARLMTLLTRWWTHPVPFIPDGWKNGFLFLLPKPGKPPNSAQNLRPLALQDVLGKVILGLISGHARHSVLDLLCSTPQMAYLPARGTSDAIARAVQHCQIVTAMIKQYQRPTERFTSGLRQCKLVGGALLSLDLSKAFDSISRHHLFSGMADLGVRPDCLQLLYEWHRGTPL